MARDTRRGAPEHSGRFTPKSGRAPQGAPGRGRTPAPSGRYTPPIPREVKVSPVWVPVLMLGLIAVGASVILLNYLDVLPGGANNSYLLVGLAFITGGFVTSTQWR